MLETTAQGIEATVIEWSGRLIDVPDNLAHEKPSEDRWSISEVIGHLVDSANNNHQRFVRARSTDSLVFPRYEQNQWVSAASYRSFDWKTLVSLWRDSNVLLAQVVRNIPEDQLSTPCTITPYEQCSLEFLVTDYLDHMKHHLAILEQRIKKL